MKLSHTVRSGLMLGAAAFVLAACDGGGEVENTGVVAPVNVTIGGGGTTPVTADGVVDFTSTACPAGAPEGTLTAGAVTITACIIPTTSALTTDLTLTAGNAYGFSGTLFVGENGIDNASAASATLTVEPGVVVFGASGEDAIVINPGSQISAVGNANNPIVFTSASDLVDADQPTTDLSAMAAASDGLVNGSTSARGEWGGLVVNGFAPINDCDVANLGTVDCVKQGEGGSGSFGGIDGADDSGDMAYVRVQYPGFLFSTDDELNGIALQAVGSGTGFSFIHVHNSADDAIEWFGGTVNGDHLATTGAGDDSLDWTDGWTGAVQFAVVVQDDTLSGDPRGFEGDSNGDNPDFAPFSNPVIANYTLVSDGLATGDDGMKIRRGTDGVFANGIISNFNGNGVDFDPSSAPQEPQFLSLYVAGSGSDAVDADATPIFDAAGAGNVRGSATLPSVYSIEETRAVAAADLADDDDNDPDLPRAGIEEVTYIGAFEESVQSYEDSWLANWALEVPEFSGQEIASQCPAGTVVSQNVGVPAGRTENNVCTLPSTVAGDLFLPAGNIYELDGTVFVGEDAGADPANPIAGASTGRLTIAAGVTLFGLNGVDALVVSRGSQIFVEGTASNPVVMTSLQDLQGQTTGRGQWGGLVVNGRAPISACDAVDLGTIDCVKQGEGGSGEFGGLTSDDNSGRINYLRVQYAGFLFGADDELNGIAFQGVGSGTEVDFIQVHQNADDGVEFFGGTVGVSHVVVTDAGDDAFDWTDGWTGNAQFVIVNEGSGVSGDPRGVEADNRSGAPANDPRSNPTIANVTLLSNDDASGNFEAVEIRRGTLGSFYNWIIAGQDPSNADDGIDFDPEATAPGEPLWFNTYVVDFGNELVDVDTTTNFIAANGDLADDVNDADFDTAAGATVGLVPSATMLGNMPTPVASFPTDSFFDANGQTYLGAVEDASDTWYLGWTIAL